MPYKRIKIRGKDLYKVINTETKEVKSEGSTLEDAKKQLRLLRDLEKKEMKEKNGGSLKASQIKKVIDLSYNNKTDEAPKGYIIDKELSDGRVKVYKDVNSPQALVVHRGSKGTRDWIDNVRYGLSGEIQTTDTYKKHEKKHQKALDKYGAENIIAIGHSRAGKYVEELNKKEPIKEVITYNKASAPVDLFRNNPKNQTDIRTDIDVVSALAPLQSHENKIVTIPSSSWNPLTAHGTTPLGKLGDKLLGKGFVGGSFNPRPLKVAEMRKFIKAFKKANGEKWSGSKIGKPELVKIFETEILKNENLDELVGGSVWTDFVKEFANKHSVKYSCALSKYKEPLRSAYKKFKEGKEWYEPIASLNPIGSTKPEMLIIPEPEEEKFEYTKLEEAIPPDFIPKKEIKIERKEKIPDIPSLDSEREKKLREIKVPELKQILKDKGFTKFQKMNKIDLINKILELENIPLGRKYEKNAEYCNYILNKSHTCYKKNPLGLKSDVEIANNYLKNADSRKEEIMKLPMGEERRIKIGTHRDLVERYKDIIKNCKLTLNELNRCEEQNKKEKSGGARYYKPNWLPPLITKYETELKKMTKSQLIQEASDNDLEADESMKKEDLINLLLDNAGLELGSRYNYSTDYPKCETIIRKAYDCYGVNSIIKEKRKELENVKKDLSRVNERIKQLQRQPVAINNKKMMREDEKLMKDMITLKERLGKLIKFRMNELKDLDYICQGHVTDLIRCEKYRVNKGEDEEEIEDPVDWEERTRIRPINQDEMMGGNKWTDFVKEFANKYDTTYGCSLSDYRTKNAYKLFKEGKDWYIPIPIVDDKRRVRFKEDELEDILEFDTDKLDKKKRKKYNYCINKRKNLSKLSNDALKKEILKLKPDFKGTLKGTNQELINEILYLKKCDELLPRKFKSILEKNIEEEKKRDDEEELVFEDFTIVDEKKDNEEEEELHFPDVKEVNDKQSEKIADKMIEEFDRLNAIRKEKGIAEYSAASNYNFILFIHLLLKYGIKCVISATKRSEYGSAVLGIVIDSVKSRTKIFKDKELLDNLKNKLQSCISKGEKIIPIPLALSIENEEHSNMLVLNIEQKTIIHFEPHGSVYSGGSREKNKLIKQMKSTINKIREEIDENKKNKLREKRNKLREKIKKIDERLSTTFYEQLKELFEVKLKKVLPDFKYYPPIEICPRKTEGVQDVENKIEKLGIEDGGYCSMWSLLFLEMVLLNPDKTINEIVDLLLKIAKNDPEYMMDVIRGYIWTARETLELFGKEKLGVDDFTFIRNRVKDRELYVRTFDKYKEWFNEMIGGSKLSRGFTKFSEKINPMSYALKNKKTRNLMTSSGDVTRDYIVPALVEAGKPVAEASAMALSTATTGNPILGKVVFDSLYKNMVEKKKYDPRANQKSKELGKISKVVGKVGEAYIGKNIG